MDVLKYKFINFPFTSLLNSYQDKFCNDVASLLRLSHSIYHTWHFLLIFSDVCYHFNCIFFLPIIINFVEIDYLFLIFSFRSINL